MTYAELQNRVSKALNVENINQPLKEMFHSVRDSTDDIGRDYIWVAAALADDLAEFIDTIFRGKYEK